VDRRSRRHGKKWMVASRRKKTVALGFDEKKKTKIIHKVTINN
jgi:hypothetical protein